MQQLSVLIRKVCLLALAAAMPALADSTSVPTRGRQAWVMCATCHGIAGEGKAAIAAPPLAGQHPSYIESQLRAYRRGDRGQHAEDVQGMRMRMLAQTIPDEALVGELAAHIATLAPAPAVAPVPAAAPTATIAAGRRLYAAQCMACHGARGEGKVDLKAPRIAGLGELYTKGQLDLFRRDLRTSADNVPAQQMSAVAAAVLRRDADLRAVVAYLATLPR